MRAARVNVACAILAGWLAMPAVAQTAAAPATFDVDPKWEGFRNRLLPSPAPTTRQDFGYRTTNHGGGPNGGEVGGRVQRSTTPAYYGRRISPRTLDNRLHASGKLVVAAAEGGSGVMIGWFNDTSRGWRTPNSLAIRIDGNGGKYWMFYEYGTCHWMTGGGGAFEGEQWQKTPTPPFQAGPEVHRWSLDYDPDDGGGRMTFRIDQRTYQVALEASHRADGATFDRFGIWNVQTPGDQAEIYLDDLEIDGQRESFDQDPQWEGVGNHAQFSDRVIRPHHDFGFSATDHCGGRAGEIGGIIFRDERPACYAAPTGPLSLSDTLRATGKLAFTQAGSDSGVYIGWFNAAEKQNNEVPEYTSRQKNYLGLLIEGPSRIGHYFRPSYSTREGVGATAAGEEGGASWPIIRPDGRVHLWRIEYRPDAAGGRGQITLALDGESRTMELSAGHRELGASFDRFGIFNLQSGGHHVEIYLDDLSFTRN